MARPRPFMPKPIKDDNGSAACTPTCRSGKDGKPTFAGNRICRPVSETCLHYIGGVIKHAKALNAFTNPTTNSYKRLVPGFEAPVLLAYSARNRSASCRIPYGAGDKAKRVEFRFPDAMANPYLAYAALLMAGLDGIQNKIHPGEAMDKNLYDLPRQSSPTFRPCAAVCVKRSRHSRQTTNSCSRATSSPRTRSKPIPNLSGKKSCVSKPRPARQNSTCITAPNAHNPFESLRVSTPGDQAASGAIRAPFYMRCHSKQFLRVSALGHAQGAQSGETGH